MNENAAIAIGIAFLVIIYFVIKMAEAKQHCDYLFGEIDRKYPENKSVLCLECIYPKTMEWLVAIPENPQVGAVDSMSCPTLMRKVKTKTTYRHICDCPESPRYGIDVDAFDTCKFGKAADRIYPVCNMTFRAGTEKEE